jgi:hypothetical protein
MWKGVVRRGQQATSESAGVQRQEGELMKNLRKKKSGVAKLVFFCVPRDLQYA